jgi:hypothetical protein
MQPAERGAATGGGGGGGGVAAGVGEVKVAPAALAAFIVTTQVAP